MSSTDTAATGQERTHQTVQGVVIIAVTLALGFSIAPYADTLAQETVTNIYLAALACTSYGLYLVFTSPLAISTAERAEAICKSRLRAD